MIDGELVFPNASGNPEFRRLQAVMGSHRQHELAVFAFDLLHHDGTDLRPIPLIKRRRQRTELVARSDVYCLHLAQVFDNGAKLLKAAERHGLEGIVQASSLSLPLGTIRDWVKTKTVAWRAANRERWRMFQRG